MTDDRYTTEKIASYTLAELETHLAARNEQRDRARTAHRAAHDEIERLENHGAENSIASKSAWSKLTLAVREMAEQNLIIQRLERAIADKPGTFRAGITIRLERGIGAATSEATITNLAARVLFDELRFTGRPDLQPLAEALEWALEAEAEPTPSPLDDDGLSDADRAHFERRKLRHDFLHEPEHDRETGDEAPMLDDEQLVERDVEREADDRELDLDDDELLAERWEIKVCDDSAEAESLEGALLAADTIARDQAGYYGTAGALRAIRREITITRDGIYNNIATQLARQGHRKPLTAAWSD